MNTSGTALLIIALAFALLLIPPLVGIWGYSWALWAYVLAVWVCMVAILYRVSRKIGKQP
jgi:asparagine N-glycosylation enzyme membrane subunit Stt3